MNPIEIEEKMYEGIMAQSRDEMLALAEKMADQIQDAAVEQVNLFSDDEKYKFIDPKRMLDIFSMMMAAVMSQTVASIGLLIALRYKEDAPRFSKKLMYAFVEAIDDKYQQIFNSDTE